MNDVVQQKRPISITIICIIGFIGVLVAIPLAFSSFAKAIGPWYPPALIITTLLGAACMIGLWKMKKWAVYLYTGLTAFNQIVLLVMGLWKVMALIMPAVIIFFGWKHLSKMT